MIDEMEDDTEFDDDPDICKNTGKPTWECPCYDCSPEIFRFKFLCIGCETIDHVIETLEGTTAYFKELKEKGYTVGGGIMDDYMYVIPPRREGHFAIRGKKDEVEYRRLKNK